MFANPNVFNLSPTDSDFKKKGIKPIPSFLNQADSTAAPCLKAKMCGEYQPNLSGGAPSTYDDAAAQLTAKYYNIWEVEAGKSAEFTQDIAHLAWSCADTDKIKKNTATPAVVVQKACIPNPYVSDTTYPGFIWKNVAFHSNFKANPLYPSKNEVDFILCFRTAARTDATAFAFTLKTGEGDVSSTGVIQA
jgi:hypothetical protein